MQMCTYERKGCEFKETAQVNAEKVDLNNNS